MYESYERIPIVIIKEYYWCPIQAYLKLTTWSEHPTPSMEEGGLTGWNREHLLQALAKMEDLDNAQLHWELPVESRRLGIAGRADLILEYDHETVVVEAKLSVTKTKLVRRGLHIIAQLAAYTIAVEETLRKPVARTYIYSTENQQLIQIPVKPHHRRLVEEAVKTINALLRGEIDPQTLPKPPRKRCTTCSYKTICPLK